MKYRKVTLFILFISIVGCNGNDRSDLPTEQILELTKGFNGDIGIYVKDLESGAEFEVNADTIFPTASMVKIPILVKIFDKIEQGELEYQMELDYGPEPEYEYSGDIISNLIPGTEVSLSELVHMMMSTSNNTASLWNQYLAGTGTEINQWLADHGYVATRVNSRTEDRGEDFETYGWGQTTPREIARLVGQIYRGEVVSSHACEQMYRIMSRNYWDGEALSQIPPTVNVASKNGAVRASRSEVLLVNAPSGDYLFSVITKNQEDSSYEYDNEAWVLIRNLSALLYNHFEPNSNWVPNRELKRYHK
ncbi:serine hydrolase [Rhodohalobacter barkolensis]|uniref:beta-lactamase n=1 Tax=Rhodohalobacter barkolensis TaxID=2053187 RepID=A0A2N0VFY8_9BACT|nr:serine hydrolase [Rhodohalobacter barkolensis]PKD43104.1 serine hydrolase [Rhodohalobacter barkolensis]